MVLSVCVRTKVSTAVEECFQERLLVGHRIRTAPTTARLSYESHKGTKYSLESCFLSYSVDTG